MNRLGKGGCIMKTRSFFMLSLAVMAMSCAKEVLPENNPEENVELKLVPMEFTTALETKAGIVDGDGTVEWAANDQITVFDNLGGKNTFTTAAGGPTSVFTGKVTEGATAFYALYPQRTSTASVLLDPENEVINSKLFPNQTAVRGSYAKGNGGAVMVAKADAENRLYFKNMTSHIRFTLAEDMTDVKSITLMGNNYEILAGTYTVDFSGAEPVLTVDKAETYVTLSNGDGPLAPGDYFFTILPVEFEAGFTVILSKTDGTQVAKKTTKEITSLKTRNQVLPMAALPSSAYKSHMNYFVKYNDGFDITFGGYTFNKSTHPDAKLVNDTYANMTISADGCYFVDSSAKLNYNKATNLIIIGSDASSRIELDYAKQLQPSQDGKIILLANCDITLSGTVAHVMALKSGVTSYGDIIFSNCHLHSLPRRLMSFTDEAAMIDRIVVEDCEYCAAPSNADDAGKSYMLTFGKKETTINEIVISNNVFYFEDKGYGIEFKLINGDLNKVNSLSVKDNTFVKTGFAGNVLKVGEITSEVEAINNLFCESIPSDATVNFVSCATSPEVTLTGKMTNNYFYYNGITAESTGKLNNGLSSKTYTSMTINTPARLSSSPLSVIWNPVEDVFGPYTFVAVNGSTVSDTVGAWRSDMKAAPETANYAAANYVSVDYGTL